MSKCQPNDYLSCVCNRGTKGCPVIHTDSPFTTSWVDRPQGAASSIDDETADGRGVVSEQAGGKPATQYSEQTYRLVECESCGQSVLVPDDMKQQQRHAALVKAARALYWSASGVASEDETDIIETKTMDEMRKDLESLSEVLDELEASDES